MELNVPGGKVSHRYRSHLVEVAALCGGYALGAFGHTAQAVWIAAFIKDGLMSISQSGWLATGELLSTTAGIVFASWCIGRIRASYISVVSTSLVIAANLLSVVPMMRVTVAGRLMSGVGMGALLATVTALAAAAEDAQRCFAIMQIGGLLVGELFFVSSPTLVSSLGPTGVFAFISVFGILVLVGLLRYLPGWEAAASRRHREAGSYGVAAVLGCVAIGTVSAGTAAVATYILVIARDIGLSSRAGTNVLALAFPFAVVGSWAAKSLGERAGTMLPVVVALTLMAVDFPIIVSARTSLELGTALAILFTSAMFYLPYAMALVSKLDGSRRVIATAPAFLMIGNAVGPVFGGELIGSGSLRSLWLAASACTGVSILLTLGCIARLSTNGRDGHLSNARLPE